MHPTVLKPKQARNKAFLRNKTSRAEMAGLKKCLTTIDLNEREERLKNHLRDFLKAAYYDKYSVNTMGKTDFMIHTGNTAKSPAGVLPEVKLLQTTADINKNRHYGA
ncbi:DUF7149 domain-containing protein [Pontibacter sp. CAU 1760]